MFANRLVASLLLAVLLPVLAQAQEKAQERPREKAQEIKPPVRGLISMGAYQFVFRGGQPFNTLKAIRQRPGIFGGIVVVASWQQLQPEPYGPLKTDNVIDRALTHIKVYNDHHKDRPLAVKLRVWGGFMAPLWARHVGGKPVHATHNGRERIVGRFWTPEYRAAFANLQRLLADKYDKEDLIREVAITQCMSFTAEPFFVPADVLPALRAANFNDQDYQGCLQQAVADYAPWQQTRLVYSFNPYNTSGSGPGDPNFTIAVMQKCRADIGVRCVLDNHDLNEPPLEPLVPIYDEMKKLGGEIEFQTFTPFPKFFAYTIQRGVMIGATGIELYQCCKGFLKVPAPTLRQWADWLEANGAAKK